MSYDEVPASEGDIYPDYCQGWSYVLTPSTAAAIVEAAKHLRFVWVDDAWVTGYIATYLNITLQVSVIEWGIKVVRAQKKTTLDIHLFHNVVRPTLAWAECTIL